MRVSFVGGGNMAEAIIGGLVGRRVVEARRIQVVEIDEDRRRMLEQRYGVKALAVVDDGVLESDLLVVAVKPQVAEEALSPLAGRVERLPLLSIMAGVRVARIRALTGAAEVVRAMPNTPALVGAGITGLFTPAETHLGARQVAEQVMRAVGEVVWVSQEELMDAVTAVSGSGPAYLLLFLEALVEGGVAVGLDPGTARRLAVATALGTAKLADASADPFDVLRERVTSRGGTTEAAVTVLTERGWREALVAAVSAARARAKALAEGG
ncbi:MAG: pyrroline-5-carboxylate reductase [Hydrogenophilus sp.]|nr:pyrroline-5-carboxylate reductase [Hydrogenophilus sp.]